MVASILTLMTFVYMSLNPEPEEILSNMAGLVILNEFDNIIVNIFEISFVK